MGFITQHLPQIAAFAFAMLFIWLANRAVPKMRSQHDVGKKSARWLAFGAEFLAGLCLAAATVPIVTWLTGLGSVGVLGQVLAVGSVIPLWLGWHGVTMGITMAKDLADGTPDQEARQAARWIPTLLPAGAAAVVGVVRNPHGLGTGLAAAIMAAITAIYVLKISKTVLAASKNKVFWTWFAFGCHVLAGIVLIPLVRFVDGTVAGYLPGAYLTAARGIAGAFGILSVIAGALDLIADRVPDKLARNGATSGVPLAVAFGSAGLAAIGSVIAGTWAALLGVF